MSESGHKFGYTTADDKRYHRKVEVYLDGKDVTATCLEADDERGIVWLFDGVERRGGSLEIVTKELHGDVRIEWKEGHEPV